MVTETRAVSGVQRLMRNRYPDDDVVWPETTRQLAALYQITAAIKHFYDGDLECAVTLASAAEGVLPERLVHDVPVGLHAVSSARQPG
jgi:hypothetical protein